MCTERPRGITSVIRRKTSFRTTVTSYIETDSIIVAVIKFPRSIRSICFARKGVVSDTRTNGILVSVAAADPALSRGLCSRKGGHKLDILSTPIANKSANTTTNALSVLINNSRSICRGYHPLFSTVNADVACFKPTKYNRRTGVTGRVVVTNTLSNIYRTLACTGTRKLSLSELVNTISAKTTNDHRLSFRKDGVLTNSFTPKFFVGRFTGSVEVTRRRTKGTKLSLGILSVALRGYHRLIRRNLKSLNARTLVGRCRG